MAVWTNRSFFENLSNCRAIGSQLGQLCSGLGVTDCLEKVIALDNDALCAQLFLIIRERGEYKKLMGLQDNDAQEMLDLLQTVCINSSASEV